MISSARALQRPRICITKAAHQELSPADECCDPTRAIGELIQRDLTDRGVPTSAIEIYRHNAPDTLDEAQTLRSLVVERKWRHVVIVTSNYHTRRARYIYQKLFPLGVQVDVASAKDPEFDVSDWWEHKAGVKRLFKELAGMCEAKWELRHTEPTPGTILGMPFGQGFTGDIWPGPGSEGSADMVTRTPRPVPQDHLHRIPT